MYMEYFTLAFIVAFYSLIFPNIQSSMATFSIRSLVNFHTSRVKPLTYL